MTTSPLTSNKDIHRPISQKSHQPAISWPKTSRNNNLAPRYRPFQTRKPQVGHAPIPHTIGVRPRGQDPHWVYKSINTLL